MITSNHPEWAETKTWLESKISEAHLQLERADLPIEEIRSLQGEVRAYRAMIEAAVVTVPGDTSTTDYHEDN